MRENKNEHACELKSQNCEIIADSLPSKMQNGDGARLVSGVHVSADMENSKRGIDNVTADSVTSPSTVLDPTEKEADFYLLLSGTQNGNGVRNVPGFHGFKGMENPVSGKDNVTGDSLTPSNIPSSELELNEKEAEFFTDKSVTDYELPKVTVCYKEGTYRVVKDICIDEGVPPVDKILVENGDVDESGDSNKETADTASPISDGIQSLVEHESVNDTAKQWGSENLIQKGEGNFDDRDKIRNKFSDKMVVPENVHSVQEFNMKRRQPELFNIDGEEGQQQNDQDPDEATFAIAALLLAAEESNDNRHASEVPFNSKLETRSITFDLNSFTTTKTGGREEAPQNTDDQQPLQTPHMSGLEDWTSDSLTTSSRSFFIQHGYGESSFSALDPLSGPLAYSGPVPYSGSISLRSDSSTTSTQSFAFPVLQSDWNSSPIKMAKADQRHVRQHQGWWLRLLCCKF